MKESVARLYALAPRSQSARSSPRLSPRALQRLTRSGASGRRWRIAAQSGGTGEPDPTGCNRRLARAGEDVYRLVTCVTLRVCMSPSKIINDDLVLYEDIGRMYHYFVEAIGRRRRGDPTAFGTRFSPLDTKAAVAAIVARTPSMPFAYVATPNAVHVVNYERGERRFVAGIDGAWLRLNDSRVVTRLARLASGTRLKLALGSDLTALMVEGAVHPDDAVTIIGGTTEMEQRLRDRHGWRNVARHEPLFGFVSDPVETDRCIDFVLAHPARYVFLACGAPQSELLGLRIVERGGAVGTGLCIGASLLFATGLEPRAPRMVQRIGLEWLHRLVREPRRMSQRLIKSQLPLLTLALRHRRPRRKHPRSGPASRAAQDVLL